MRKGIERADHELEISHFIKYQKFMRTMMRTLFSDVERFLIRNQYNTILDSSEENEVVSSSGSEVDEERFLKFMREKDSIFTMNLLRGAFRRQGKQNNVKTEDSERTESKKIPKQKEELLKVEDYKEEDVTLDQLAIERGKGRSWKKKPKRSHTNPQKTYQLHDAQVLYEPQVTQKTKKTLNDKKHYEVNAP